MGHTVTRYSIHDEMLSMLALFIFCLCVFYFVGEGKVVRAEEWRDDGIGVQDVKFTTNQ